MFKLTGKTAVVTGGGSGIGRAIAQTFARQGAHVILLEADAEAGARTAAEIQSEGGSATSHTCNVTHQQEVQTLFNKLIAQHGRLNILVNNAGIAHVGNVLNTTGADFDRVMAVNVKGVYHCIQACAGHMAQFGGGAIVNIASTVSVMAINDRFAYATSKGAVLAMTYSVAKDLLKQNVRCNAILPGRIHTPFVDGFIAKNYPGREAEMFQKLSDYQPVGRMGEPNEVAAVALFLCSDEASFITGSHYPVDGGTLHIR